MKDIELDIELTDKQWKELVELRGGCSCHLYPPCWSCSDPITQKEAELLGIVPDGAVAQMESARIS